MSSNKRHIDDLSHPAATPPAIRAHITPATLAEDQISAPSVPSFQVTPTISEPPEHLYQVIFMGKKGGSTQWYGHVISVYTHVADANGAVVQIATENLSGEVDNGGHSEIRFDSGQYRWICNDLETGDIVTVFTEQRF